MIIARWTYVCVLGKSTFCGVESFISETPRILSVDFNDFWTDNWVYPIILVVFGYEQAFANDLPRGIGFDLPCSTTFGWRFQGEIPRMTVENMFAKEQNACNLIDNGNVVEFGILAARNKLLVLEFIYLKASISSMYI